MTSQRFLFLLILVMLITPVTSVFSHYSSMASQLVTEHDTVHTTALNTDQCQQHNKPKLSCDTNSLCSFSVCGYGNISVAFLLWIQAYSTYRYRQIKKTFLRSLIISPEIKPPIYSF
jgi:ABC-type spermidine/putrescine transport system permease subunit II